MINYNIDKSSWNFPYDLLEAEMYAPDCNGISSFVRELPLGQLYVAGPGNNNPPF